MSDLRDILKPREQKFKKPEVYNPAQMTLLDVASGKKSGKGKSAKIGKQFEKDLKVTCKLYKQRKLAMVQFNETPMIYLPDKKIWVHGGKTGFDFVGAIVSTKEAVFIEAKTTEHGMIAVGYDTTGIKKHQIEAMDWLEKVGFKPFFLWEIRRSAVVYKFFPSQIPNEVKNLTIQHCEEFKFIKILKQSFEGEMLYDFLELL